jgi:hypothetical protein
VARIRSVKPELWDDEALGRTPVGSRLLFLGMISLADDEGRLRSSPHLLRARLFAYNDDLDLEQVTGWLNALALAGVIDLYVFEGQTFAHICNWERHQRVDKPRPSSLPGPSEGRVLVTAKDSRGLKSDGSYEEALETDDLQDIPEDSRGFANVRENSSRKGMEGNGVEGKGSNSNVESSGLDESLLVRELFAYWQEKCHHPNAKLGNDRRGPIRARLREGYSAAFIRKAIDGASIGAFVSDSGKRFDDLTLICRNGSKLEDFAGRCDPAARVVSISKAQRKHDELEALKQRFTDEDGNDAA